MGNNTTTANKAGVGGFVGLLALWILRAFVPADVLAANPLPEEAVIVVATWLFCRVVPADAGGAGRAGRGALALLLGLCLVGCATNGAKLLKRCGVYTATARATVATLLAGVETGLVRGDSALDAAGDAGEIMDQAARACAAAAIEGDPGGVADAVAQFDEVQASAALALGGSGDE